MITYEKVYTQYEYYKACYERIDSFYWDHLDYDQSGNVIINPDCIDDLRIMYREYRAQSAEVLTVINEYMNSHFKLYNDNIPLMKRDIADYDARLEKMLKKLI